jgi:hypothetical protein
MINLTIGSNILKRIISILVLLVSLSCTNNQNNSQNNDANKSDEQLANPTPITTITPQAGTTPSPTPIPQSEQHEAVAIAQQMYTLHFKENQSFEVSHYKEWFAPQLYSLLMKDREESAKFHDEIAGLDFNPLTNTQEDVGPLRLTIAKASNQEADLNVMFTDDPKNQAVEATLTLKMVKNGDKWQIKNILYPGGDAKNSDLISILKEIEKERNQMQKEAIKPR